MAILVGALILLGAVLTTTLFVFAVVGALFRIGGWFSLMLYTMVAFVTTLALGIGGFVLWLRA